MNDLVLNIGLNRERDSLPALSNHIAKQLFRGALDYYFPGVDSVSYSLTNFDGEHTLVCRVNFNVQPCALMSEFVQELCHLFSQDAIPYKYLGKGHMVHHMNAKNNWGEFNEQYFTN
jgi:hypothetical protein